MNRRGIVNHPLASLVAGLGHADTIVVTDAGLPFPPQTEQIDLALTRGAPNRVLESNLEDSE